MDTFEQIVQLQEQIKKLKKDRGWNGHCSKPLHEIRITPKVRHADQHEFTVLIRVHMFLEVGQ